MRWTAATTMLAGLLWAAPVFAHGAAYSFLEIRLTPDALRGEVGVLVSDVGHELAWSRADSLVDSTRAAVAGPQIAAILAPRLHLSADGKTLPIRFGEALADPLGVGLTLPFSAALERRPGTLEVEARLFPYDAKHQTYLNVYEGDSLKLQTVLDRHQQRARLFSGARQGRLAVTRTFLASGIQHIFTGPDHVLFVIALLLLGGGIARLLKVVTAFTLAHSITLALATLRIVDPPGRVIEPMIALSIVLVGLDNLRARPGNDHRATLAFLFGLVHGFGFASVLREFGLPLSAVGWSLFSFNLGVEVGQAVIVTSIAPLLGLLRSRSPQLAASAVRYGSFVVILAGAYWFGERLLMGAR